MTTYLNAGHVRASTCTRFESNHDKLFVFLDCGIKNRQEHLDFFERLILGGRNARHGEWPWMAFIAKSKFVCVVLGSYLT